MTDFGQVDVKEITSDIPRSNFSEDEIEALADTILENSGLVRPLILKQNDVDSYSVIDGHLEYYAAVRTREKDARKGEIVNAFVIKPKQEEAVRQQIQAIKTSTDLGIKIEKPVSNVQSQSSAELSSWITSFETRLSQLREDLSIKVQNNELRFQKLEKYFEAKDTDLLTIINKLDEDKLAIRLSQCGISSYAKVAKSIYASRLQKEDKLFKDYQDIVNSTKGLGDKSMLRLIDGWSRISKS